MVIELDFASDTPIYVQLRNQIVKGIGKGELKAGEKLPTVRQLASDAGVNTMTINKTYQILKAELELLSAEACITGMDKEEFLKMCENIYSKMNPCAM